MTIDDVFKWVNFVANKKQSGAISDDEFNMIVAVVSIDYFKLEVGLPEEYQVGQPMPRRAYQITQKITDDVRHLLERAPIVRGAVTSDYFAIPANYGAYSGLFYRYTYNPKNCKGAVSVDLPIEVVTDAEFHDRKACPLLGPTFKQPIANFDASGIIVYPLDIQNIELSYLRLPTKPFRNYKIVSDESVYCPLGNEAGVVYPGVPSTNFDFPETCHNDLCIRVLQYVGINLGDAELIAMIKERKLSGQ